MTFEQNSFLWTPLKKRLKDRSKIKVRYLLVLIDLLLFIEQKTKAFFTCMSDCRLLIHLVWENTLKREIG